MIFLYPIGYNPNSFISNPGKRIKDEFAGSLNPDGTIDLEKIGETDLWEMHDSAQAATDINNIYQRFCNGDISVLARRQGNLGDVTGMPSSLRESLDLVRQGEEVYERLPQSLKEQYPTIEDFFSDVGSQKLENFLQQAASAAAPSAGEDLPSAEEQTE